MIKAPIVVAACVLATGCIAISVEEKPAARLDIDRCGADGLQSYIGKPESALDQAKLPKVHRVIPHGGMGTMDFRPERATILLDKDGLVESIRCG